MSSQPAFESDSVVAVRYWLQRHRLGDGEARQELLEVSMRRLRLLAKKILGDIPAVRRAEETDDLLQNSVLRLWKYLCESRPETPADYFRLAACMIRRELIDLSRRHFGHRQAVFGGEPGIECASGFEAVSAVEARADSMDPVQLSQWTEFHEYIERLPEEDRSLFDLLWYQGLTMGETSELLSIPLRTLGRKWKLVRLQLYRELLAGPDELIPAAVVPDPGD